MKKLFVAGCSFSDFTKVKTVYGQHLAKKLNYEYVHEGAGCGSNWRIWRVITNHILSGNLTSDDLLIIQYTTIERNEFWTSIEQPNSLFDPKKTHHVITERYKLGGAVTRFKAFSHTWQQSKIESTFHNMYEEHFLSSDFEKEKFEVHNHMFQSMLKLHNIKAIFLKTFRYQTYNVDCLPEYERCAFIESHNQTSDEMNLTDQDHAHLSEFGHTAYAELLFNHVDRIGLNR
jgi:hypothetical protein